jgi:hypothetical protein
LLLHFFEKKKIVNIKAPNFYRYSSTDSKKNRLPTLYLGKQT